MGYMQKVLLVCLYALLSACVMKPPTTYDYDTSYNFGQLKTYAWLPDSEDHVSTLDDKRQRNAIETVLNRKGFKKVEQNGKASFLLKVHTITDKKVDVDHFYSTWGYHPFFYPDPRRGYPWPHMGTTSVREYQVGTLVLDIVDPVKKQVIWRGSISKSLGIYRNRSPEERATIAMSTAEHLLATFPPQRMPKLD
ncbi:DUF4136 domain-containing protein [Aliikangiella sp. G2MR2-5]|uniref:DUF4136 domain-containing protein n=1 Tax=Aliikangiella sp. G2MR2-5 TaxID=2788943 RepID=UPI0018AB8D65|nr:DUF4136 domain-containing protein [Aliikangiella sp. G2MR2-5]